MSSRGLVWGCLLLCLALSSYFLWRQIQERQWKIKDQSKIQKSAFSYIKIVSRLRTPSVSLLDGLLDISLRTYLSRNSKGHFSHPLILLKKPLVKLNNVSIHGFDSIKRDCATTVSMTTHPTSTFKKEKDVFITVCFRIDALSMVGALETAVSWISSKKVNVSLPSTAFQMKLQVLPSKENRNSSRMLLLLTQLRITRWSGFHLTSVDTEAGRGIQTLFTLVEYTSWINAIPTRFLLERLLVMPINEFLSQLSIVDPFNR